MADRFFSPSALVPGEMVLEGADAHHLGTVRRFEVGDCVVLFDGSGCEFPAEILSVGKRSVSLIVSEPQDIDRELSPALIIASAVPKGDRADYLVEKLTELGVSRWVPLITERSVVIPRDSAKFERMVIEASKQCGRNVLMKVDPPTRWLEFAARAELPTQRWILHPSGKEILPGERVEDQVFAIGPEGGFSERELEVPGWQLVSMGSRILRVETAAVAAAALASVTSARRAL